MMFLSSLASLSYVDGPKPSQRSVCESWGEIIIIINSLNYLIIDGDHLEIHSKLVLLQFIFFTVSATNMLSGTIGQEFNLIY